MKTLRVFVASPRDVEEERTLVRTVAAEVNSMLKRANADVQLEALGWETDVPPGLNAQGPQGKIDAELDFAGLDIVVGIFWQRFGTIVHGDDSGTTHEIRHALALWRDQQRPDVWLYFRDEPHRLKTSDDAEQMLKVLRFPEIKSRSTCIFAKDLDTPSSGQTGCASERELN